MEIKEIDTVTDSDDSFSTDFEFIEKKETLAKPKTNYEIWFERLKYQIKNSSKLDVLLVLFMVFIVVNSYRTFSDNERLFEMISKIDSRITKLEGNMEMILSNTCQTTECKLERLKSMNSDEDLFGDQHEDEPSNSEILKQEEPLGVALVFKATSGLFDSFLDFNQHFDQIETDTLHGSSLVLLEHQWPPVDRQWCTTVQFPKLTANLGKLITPISISYQHSKWNGRVPGGAPRKYMAWGCLDVDCDRTILLTNICEYKSDGNNQQEQLCPVLPSATKTPIVKIQFKVIGNHGSEAETCINHVRVYGKLHKKKVKTTTTGNNSNQLPFHLSEKQLASTMLATGLVLFLWALAQIVQKKKTKRC